jgi:hypothetical protein
MEEWANELESRGVDLDTTMVALGTADLSATLTTEEAAEILGVTPRRVLAMLSRSVLEGRKRSGVWFIGAKSVDELAQLTRKAGRPRN